MNPAQSPLWEKALLAALPACIHEPTDERWAFDTAARCAAAYADAVVKIAAEREADDAEEGGEA